MDNPLIFIFLMKILVSSILLTMVVKNTSDTLGGRAYNLLAIMLIVFIWTIHYFI